MVRRVEGSPRRWGVRGARRLASMAEPLMKVAELEKRLLANWSHLRQARAAAEEMRRKLRSTLDGLDSADTSIVVSGSLARDEFTSGSDIDWTLLIDGDADPRHHDLSARSPRESARWQPNRQGPKGRSVQWYSVTG